MQSPEPALTRWEQHEERGDDAGGHGPVSGLAPQGGRKLHSSCFHTGLHAAFHSGGACFYGLGLGTVEEECYGSSVTGSHRATSPARLIYISDVVRNISLLLSFPLSVLKSRTGQEKNPLMICLPSLPRDPATLCMNRDAAPQYLSTLKTTEIVRHPLPLLG